MDQIGECHFADHRRALGSLLAAGFAAQMRALKG
jgi:hypothetical protein